MTRDIGRAPYQPARISPAAPDELLTRAIQAADRTRRLALVASATRPRRPAAAPAGRARASHGRAAAPGSPRGTSSRSRPPPCRSRPATRRISHAFAHRAARARRRAAAALPAHLAGIRLQEAARGRRAADLHAAPRVPQPRARGRCTIPDSPCSNGTAPAQPYESADATTARRSCALAAEAAGAPTCCAGAAARPIPFAEPERLTSPTPSAATPASTCWPRWRRRRRDRDALAARRGAARHAGRRRTTPGPISSAGCWSSASSRTSASAARPSSCEYPGQRGGAGAADARTIRAFAERFELYRLRRRARQRLRRTDRPDEQRRRFEAEMAEKRRVYGERYPIDEDFLAALGADAAGQRHRARLRPAGDAGDRRRAHRAGAVDAGRRVEARCADRRAAAPSRATSSHAGLRRAELDADALAAGGGALRAWRSRRVAELIDPRDPRRPDRAAVRARRGANSPPRRTSAPIRSATTRTVPVEGIVHRYPDRVLLKLMHACAVYCRFCFRREMVGPGRRARSVARGARRGARLYRRAGRRSGR